MSNFPIRNIDTAPGVPVRIDFADKCRLRPREGALDIMADAAFDIPRKSDGTPNISALVKLRGGSAADFKAKLDRAVSGGETLARVLLLHAQRRGITPGQALDELYEIEIEAAATGAADAELKEAVAA